MNFTETEDEEEEGNHRPALSSGKRPSRNEDIKVLQFPWSGPFKGWRHRHDSGLFWTWFSGQREPLVAAEELGGWRMFPWLLNFMALKKSAWGDRGWAWIQERPDIRVSGITSMFGWNSIALTTRVYAFPFFLTTNQCCSLCLGC